jgi:three-Cys-motif partner protein
MKVQRSFGGEWSNAKLAALKDYLASYAKVMKNTPFRTLYIDAFAGAGTEEEGDDESQYRHGSPLIALETDPQFDQLVFIDKGAAKLNRLKCQVEERGHGSRLITYRPGDANEELRGLCRSVNWKSHRAVAFLDPFALQVRWDTIQAIARTQAIDMWLLFPAMAVNRMLTRSGEIDPSWERRLDLTFGANSWKTAFYGKEDPDLFGHEKVVKASKPFDVLSEFVTLRLKAEFAAVHSKPLVLKNTSGTPIFLFCFACGNKRGAAPALRIANHIIRNQSNGQ